MIVPDEAFHVTDVFELLPLTLAVNWTVPLVIAEVDVGESVMELTAGFAGADAETVTVADADLVVSATLVAVTVAEPAAAGAV